MVDKAKFAAQEEALGYRLNINGRNVFVTEAMKNHAIEKLSKLDRFHNHVTELHVTLDIQKMEHTCIIVMKFDHFKVKVSCSSSDMYASIDKAVDKLKSKITRWKSRIQDHHKKGLKVVDMEVNVLGRPFDTVDEYNDEIESENKKEIVDEYRSPKIIGNDKRSLKHLTAEEAIMKMELSDDPFMIFRGEEDRKLKVIYRRNDGNYGLILPE
ncbi:MAG TPA: ribosome-associated translation inhibitor RaiA [Rhabdochlamydiaceae bacterium]|jgi:putative sigma-54 modulation protein|nr:ribosome-associated translation inhibitor RaiA [Rhabdochlamydiaceae bacterium]